MAAQFNTNTNTLSAFQARKLLIICPTDTWGGVEKNVRLRAAAMSERGHKVTVLLLKNTFEDRFTDLPHVEIDTIPFRPSDLSPRLYWQFFQAIKKCQPHCVFVPLKKDWWAATVAAHWAQVPQRVLYLGIKRRIKENLKYRLLFKYLQARLIVNSKDLKNHLKESNRFLNDSNLKLIYNGFKLPDRDIISGDFRERLGIPTNAPVVGCAGRFSAQKGFDMIPDILRGLPGDVHFVVAGGGALEDELRARFKKAYGTERIHLIGPQSDMSMFYRTLDVFLLPSRNEGMANVLNEALSYGLPAISTNVPGSSELLEAYTKTSPLLPGSNGVWQGKHGLMTLIDDVDSLTRALKAITTGEVHFDPEQQRGKIRRDHDLTIMMDLTEQAFFRITPNEEASTTHHKAEA